MSKKVGIIIIGGTGFGAGELLRILSQHEEVEVLDVVSRSLAGINLADAHTHLDSIYDLVFSEEINLENYQGYDQLVFFLALPHGISANKINELVNSDIPENSIMIDLSGDFRLSKEDIHKNNYPETDFYSDLRNKFVYGLSELNKEVIKDSRFIANPGCYPTASILAAAPLLQFELSSTLVFDGKSGTSGGGRNPQAIFHHPVRNANLQAYKVMEHRHEDEIHDGLGDPDCNKYNIQFVPHLIPISRGIEITCYTSLKSEISTEELNKVYKVFYQDRPFVRIREQAPEIRDVVGSNYCDIYVKARGKQIVTISVIDNLVKGMAGQAVQNMNLILGFDETAGLKQASLGLV